LLFSGIAERAEGLVKRETAEKQARAERSGVVGAAPARGNGGNRLLTGG
jgi:hypothetical protein